MKIGFFTESYLPQLDGLATSFVGIMAKALEDRGHEVYIIAPWYPGYKDKNKRVYRIASVKVHDEPELRLALQIPEKALFHILKIDFDMIHGFPGLAGVTAVGLQMAKLRGIPKIATFHTFFSQYTHYLHFPFSFLTPKMIDKICKMLANRFDYVIAPVEKVKKEMINIGVTKPIEIMPVGIDIENYKNIKKGYLREKIKIAKNTKVLLFVGRLGEEKSVEFLIYSFEKIIKKDQNVVFVLVGTGPDKEKLKVLVKELGIEKNVFFLGTVPHEEIPKIYADSDLFIFASQTETQGMVIYEAAASGLPVVVVKDQIYKDIVLDGENGYQVERNHDEFAEKVLRLLSDEKLYAAFSQKTKEIVNKFSTKNMAERLEKLYLKLIDEKKNKRKRRLNYFQYLFRT